MRNISRRLWGKCRVSRLPEWSGECRIAYPVDDGTCYAVQRNLAAAAGRASSSRGFVWRFHSPRDLNTAPRRPLARGTAARLQMSCGGRLRRRHVRERHCTARDVGSWVQQPSARARTSLRSTSQIRRAAGSPSEQAAAKAPKGFKTRAATPGGARHRSAARGRHTSNLRRSNQTRPLFHARLTPPPPLPPPPPRMWVNAPPVVPLVRAEVRPPPHGASRWAPPLLPPTKRVVS